MKRGDEIEIGGETWKIVAVGATCDARTYLHLAHTSRGTQGRAGFIPIQQCGWFDGAELHDQAAE
jgi:hypothetical protein